MDGEARQQVEGVWYSRPPFVRGFRLCMSSLEGEHDNGHRRSAASRSAEGFADARINDCPSW